MKTPAELYYRKVAIKQDLDRALESVLELSGYEEDDYQLRECEKLIVKLSDLKIDVDAMLTAQNLLLTLERSTAMIRRLEAQRQNQAL